MILGLVRDIAEYAGDGTDYVLVQLMRIEDAIVACMLIFIPAFTWFATRDGWAVLAVTAAVFIPTCLALGYMFANPPKIRAAVEVIVELTLFWIPVCSALAFAAWKVIEWVT